MRCSQGQVADENTEKTYDSAQNTKGDGDCCVRRNLVKSQLKLVSAYRKGVGRRNSWWNKYQ
jgi:hypothetical protein